MNCLNCNAKIKTTMIITDLLEIKDDGTSRESKSFLSDDDENQVFLLLLNYYSTHF